jgi:DHA1 family inner membrane transport protein
MRARDEGENPAEKPRLSERRILLLLAAVQFTHIMDFMVMMPLGPQLMRDLAISPQRFGSLISSFAITAGVVGLLLRPSWTASTGKSSC